jgi:hypothetical protein
MQLVRGNPDLRAEAKLPPSVNRVLAFQYTVALSTSARNRSASLHLA